MKHAIRHIPEVVILIKLLLDWEKEKLNKKNQSLLNRVLLCK